MSSTPPAAEPDVSPVPDIAGHFGVYGRLFAPESDPRYHPLGVEIQPFILTERSGKAVTLDRGLFRLNLT